MDGLFADTNPNDVRLPDVWIARCWKHARKIVCDYAVGKHAPSLAVSSHGAEKNIGLQAQAKMAEVAFAIWCGCDPEAVVNWSGEIDPGFDVFHKIKFDVKHTAHGHRLIWPINKNDFFDSKDFDALVLVRGESPLFNIWKWIWKKDFRRGRLIAGEGHDLTPGTRYMDGYDCCDVDLLQDFLLPKKIRIVIDASKAMSDTIEQIGRILDDAR
jgi:hypothetical protein